MSADVEGAARAWLRTVPGVVALIGQRTFFGTPSAAPSCITISESGGSPEANGPLDRPVLSFSCWASYNPTTRTAGTKAEARAIRNALVDALQDLGDHGHVDIDGTRLLNATVLTAYWMPDTTTTPDTPRYVVDAEFRAVQLVS